MASSSTLRLPRNWTFATFSAVAGSGGASAPAGSSASASPAGAFSAWANAGAGASSATPR
jgi:hypothetical protein